MHVLSRPTCQREEVLVCGVPVHSGTPEAEEIVKHEPPTLFTLAPIDFTIVLRIFFKHVLRAALMNSRDNNVAMHALIPSFDDLQLAVVCEKAFVNNHSSF
jgi:hypothetical protein